MPVQFQREGAQVVLLGGFGQTDADAFRQQRIRQSHPDQLWGLPPQLDMDYEKRVHDAMREIIAAGLAESAHDLSDGGLAVALSESCTAEIGAEVTIAIRRARRTSRSSAKPRPAF